METIQTPKPPAAAPAPDWVRDNPDPSYELVLWWDGASVQEVGLTRDEYIGLKQVLAAMRDYPVTADGQISQDTLIAIMRQHQLVCRMARRVHAAVLAGARIEPGEWTAKLISPNPLPDSWDTENLAGLTIEELDIERVRQ